MLMRDSEFIFRIKLFRCPSCEKISTIATGVGTAVHGLTVPIYPASFAVQFPEYVPVQIRSDYEEAYAILSISPKASATLSRRCLQGMIHDFWDIHEKNLNAEITALKPHISASQWKALDVMKKKHYMPISWLQQMKRPKLKNLILPRKTWVSFCQ